MTFAWPILILAIFFEVVFFVLLKQTSEYNKSWVYIFLISPLLIASIFCEQKAIQMGLSGSLVYIVWSVSGIITLALVGNYLWQEYLNAFGVAMIFVMVTSCSLFIQFGYKINA